jgi:polyhydroxyalkanoate synthesis regulator phasin
MKTLLILAASLAAGLTLTAAAQAQPPETRERVTVYPAGRGDVDRGDWTLKRREDWLNDKINQAHDQHALGGREADRAHHELDRLRDDENHMRDRHDGQLTDNETSSLEARLDGLADQIVQLHNEAWRRPW